MIYANDCSIRVASSILHKNFHVIQVLQLRTKKNNEKIQ